MTSKIVVNNIEADSGINTITFINEVTAPTFNGNIVGTAATFSGNLSVGGVLTYEDVTSVDAVGLSTFQNGIHVTSGLVGIGTDIPTKKLQVFDPSATSTTARANTVARFLSNASNADCNIQLSNGVDHSAQIGIVGNGAEVYIAQDGVENLRIDSSGNVGIGTDNPISNLQVFGTNGIRITNSANQNATTLLNFESNHPAFRMLNTSGDTTVKFKSDGNSFITSGNLGIGTDNPQSKLDVAGEVRASGIAITESYPTIRPSLNLNFARSRSLDHRITFTRASVGTYVGRNGLIKTAGENVARFDHDPETLESLGLLIEESRINYVNHYLVNSGNGWATNQRIIFSSTTEPAPDGSSNNQKMAANTDAGVSHSTYKQVTGAAAGTVHTFSVYMKSAGSDYGYIYVDTSGGRYGGVAVQFSTGNTAVLTANGIGTQTDTSVTAVGNGWYRLSVSGSFSNTTQHYCHIDVGNDLSFSTFAGNGTDGIYVWGAQLEAGSFPTSIIPTSGSSATRTAENTLIHGQSFTDFYNQQESTILCNFTQNAPSYASGGASANERAYRIRAATGSDTRIDYVTYNQYHPYIAGDGSAIVDLAGFTNLYEGLENRTAVRVKENDFASALNGQIKSTATSGSWPPSNTMTEVAIGTPNPLNGHIKSFVYYPKALPDAQLISLTA